MGAAGAGWRDYSGAGRIGKAPDRRAGRGGSTRGGGADPRERDGVPDYPTRGRCAGVVAGRRVRGGTRGARVRVVFAGPAGEFGFDAFAARVGSEAVGDAGDGEVAV